MAEQGNGIPERGLDVLPLEARIVLEDVLLGDALGDQAHDQFDGDRVPLMTGFPAITCGLTSIRWR